MSRITRLGSAAAILTCSAAPFLYATTVSTPTPSSSLSIATYYNSGSGFTSAWQPGGSGGAAPSSGKIIRLSAFYSHYDATTGNTVIYDLGQGPATAAITLTVSGYSYTIGSTASCACRSVEFSPGLSVGSVSYSGVTLGTQNAYTLVMTVASTPDPTSPITASYQYGGSLSGVNLEQNEIFYTSTQSVAWVAVLLVNYTNASASQDFLTYTSHSASDARTIYFTLPGDNNTYQAVFSSSVSKVIVQLKQTDTLTAYSTGITWWQTVPGNEAVYAWFFPSLIQPT